MCGLHLKRMILSLSLSPQTFGPMSKIFPDNYTKSKGLFSKDILGSVTPCRLRTVEAFDFISETETSRRVTESLSHRGVGRRRQEGNLDLPFYSKGKITELKEKFIQYSSLLYQTIFNSSLINFMTEPFFKFKRSFPTILHNRYSS